MLIRHVEAFLRTHKMPATKFGRLAANDPRFVLDLRMGRLPRPETEARTRHWMAQYEAQSGAQCGVQSGAQSHGGALTLETKGMRHAA